MPRSFTEKLLPINDSANCLHASRSSRSNMGYCSKQHIRSIASFSRSIRIIARSGEGGDRGHLLALECEADLWCIQRTTP